MIKAFKEQLKTLTYIIKLHKNRKGYFLKNLFFYQIVSMFPIATGLAIKRVFEQFTLDPLNNRIWWAIVLFLSLLMGRIIFVVFNAYYNSKGRFIMSADIRMNLLSGILKKPGAESLNLATGDVLNRIKEDVNQIEDFAYGAMLDVITSFVYTIVALAILFSIDFVMTILVFTPILLMVYVMERSGRRVSKYRLANRNATGNVSSAIGETFANIQAVQVNAAEESVLIHLKKLNQERAKNATKDNVFSQILGTLYENLFNIGTGIILLFMALMNGKGAFSLGNFVLFTYFMNFISFFIMFSGNAFTRYKQIQVSFDHLGDIHESISSETLVESPSFNPSEVILVGKKNYKENAALNDPLERLTVKDVSYTYPNSQNGIKKMSLTLEKDSLTVIAGRIGSGKSTLLKTISGLLIPDRGTLHWNDIEVDDAREVMTPPRLAYTPQIPKFFSTTIMENMKLGFQSTEKQEENSIHCSVMEHDIEGLSEGINTPIGTNGVKLSGGQQLRLAVARMLLRDTNIYAFDDISSALDIETDTKMWERLLEKRNGTYLVVSNQKRILQKADQVILLKDGQLEATGTLNELLDSHEEMRLILDGVV